VCRGGMKCGRPTERGASRWGKNYLLAMVSDIVGALNGWPNN